MNPSYLCLWYAASELAVPKLTAQESAALVMVAASILVFRTFRERYLLVWTVGWLGFFASRWALRDPDLAANGLQSVAVSQASFVLAICLFATAILIYSNAKKLLLPLALITAALAGYAVARALLWPDSVGARIPLEVGYRLVVLAAAVQMLRSRWGRWEIGPWLMALCLLFVHLDWSPYTDSIPAGVWLMTELLLGLSMLFVVFDDSRIRTKRLRVINALTATMARAQQHGPLMQTALEEIKKAMRAKGAWFRLMESDRTGTTHHVGVSPDFVKASGLLSMDPVIEKALAEAKPTVVAAGD